jgi:sugar/nucleoside kinase (ribokinase family)
MLFQQKRHINLNGYNQHMGLSTACKWTAFADSSGQDTNNVAPFAKVNWHEFLGCGDTAKDKNKTRKIPAAPQAGKPTVICRHGSTNKFALMSD